MKHYFITVAVISALAVSAVIRQKARAQNGSSQPTGIAEAKPDADPAKPANQEPFEIPAGYRDWQLISVSREEGSVNVFRAQLGNDLAIKAIRAGKLPFPDGSVIAVLNWNYAPSEENDKAFGRSQSFVAGSAKNVEFMAKDSKKYAATGGWRFADFTDGKPADETALEACFACHQDNKTRDFVFTRYSP